MNVKLDDSEMRRHEHRDIDFELPDIHIKTEPGEFACGPSDSLGHHPCANAGNQCSNLKTELGSGNQLSSNFQTELDSDDRFSSNIEIDAGGQGSSIENEVYEPTERQRDNKVLELEYDVLSEVKIKSEPVDDYGREPDYVPPGSESEKWEGVGHELGPVPLNLIPAAGSRDLLRIDIEDPLHPVQSGEVKEEPSEANMAERSYPFSEVGVSHDQDMETNEATEDNIVSSTYRDSSEINYEIQPTEGSLWLIGYSLKNYNEAGVQESNTCCYCSKAFADKYRLARHKRIHTGEKPFKCNVCDRAFITRGNLLQHERIHTGERPFACDQCDKTFTTQALLVQHRHVHLAERPFACDNCEKTFSRYKTLVSHQSVHTGGRPFACDQCDKTFTRVSNLHRHKLDIHSGKRPFPCAQCDKSFVCLNSLSQHVKIHTGERPFACDQCDRMFSSNSILTRHKHIHTEERPHACDQCDKTFTLRSLLKEHRRIHTGERPYACGQCDKTFTHRSGLKYHKQRVH